LKQEVENTEGHRTLMIRREQQVDLTTQTLTKTTTIKTNTT